MISFPIILYSPFVLQGLNFSFLLILFVCLLYLRLAFRFLGINIPISYFFFLYCILASYNIVIIFIPTIFTSRFIPFSSLYIVNLSLSSACLIVLYFFLHFLQVMSFLFTVCSVFHFSHYLHHYHHHILALC